MILYHGSPNRIVYPSFGLGDDRHDYGKGFYLTQDLNLAKEWAVCRPETESGYVHTFVLDTDGLSIFDYEKENILCWLSELMKHRDATELAVDGHAIFKGVACLCNDVMAVVVA